MAVGFGSVEFKVVPGSDARLPIPVAATDSDTRTYDASLLLDNLADYDTLEDYISRFDILPAMGGGGIIVVKAGTGVETLTIPISNGSERSYDAILVSLDASVFMLQDAYLACEASFLVIEET